MRKICMAFVSLFMIAFVKPDRPGLRIFMAGDSTMQAYNPDKTPQRGWGQVFARFFNSDVAVNDLARGGRSTKSYLAEGLWDKLVAGVRKDDWVFIEFGHNDHDKRKPERFCTPEQYENNLIKMVHDVKQKGAHAVILSPIAMRSFDKQGKYYDGHASYPLRARMAALESGVPFIDADSLLGAVVVQLGPDRSKDLYMNFGPGLYSAFPDGHSDNTHLREAGALKVCELVVAAMKRLELEPINQYLK